MKPAVSPQVPGGVQRPPLRQMALDVYRARLYVPTHFRVYLRDVVGTPSDHADARSALRAAGDWILRAYEAGRGGASAYYSLATGWSPPYAETTGYIIPTMFDYFRYSRDDVYRKSALGMAEWELEIQMPDGAFPGGHSDTGARPVVFNTGQVLQGLVSAYDETGSERYRAAAVKAGEWLLSIQEPDGSWVRHTYRNTFHTYHTRVAWPLCQLHRITGDDRYASGAVRNLEWALKNQLPNGWFRHNAIYFRTDHALTHSIAYAIEGFLEAGVLLSRADFITAARKASDVLLNKFESTGWLQASYDHQWSSQDQYSCVTGNAQMAICWFRLSKLTGDARYAAAARRMNCWLMSTQDIHSPHPGIRGGIKGSHPIYGAYMPMRYLNWATKFFMDALLLEQKLTVELS